MGVRIVRIFGIACLMILLAGGLVYSQEPQSTEPASTADAEKEKAKNPYANDFGPEAVDVSSYPDEAKEGYKAFAEKCSKCHTIARPLNSQFTELKKEELDMLKAQNSKLVQEPLIWQIEEDIWQRYVKRMMNKPGCDIPKEDGKKIWKFLVHDSKLRKLGDNAQAWETNRRKLMEDFKAKDPTRYKELYEIE